MKQPADRSWIKEYLIPIGSVLITALILFAQYPQLQKYVVIIAILYFVLVAVVLLYIPSVRLLSSLLNKWRTRRLAKACFSELTATIKKLQLLMAPENTNTLLRVFELAAHFDQKRGQLLLPDPEHIQTVRNWLSSIEERAARYRLGEFPTLCVEMGYLIQQYNLFLCQRLIKLQGFIAGGGFDENQLRQLKQYWNVNRDAYNASIRGWENLAKKLNDKTGGSICFDYYKPVGTLE